jgi:hypothetical protein
MGAVYRLVSIRKMLEAAAIACVSVACWVDALKVASQIHFVQHDKGRWLACYRLEHLRDRVTT